MELASIGACLVSLSGLRSMDTKGCAFPFRRKTVATGNSFWNIHFQRNVGRTECRNCLNVPSSPRKQLRLASVKPWIQVGSQPHVGRPLSFGWREIQTETQPNLPGFLSYPQGVWGVERLPVRAAQRSYSALAFSASPCFR